MYNDYFREIGIVQFLVTTSKYKHDDVENMLESTYNLINYNNDMFPVLFFGLNNFEKFLTHKGKKYLFVDNYDTFVFLNNIKIQMFDKIFTNCEVINELLSDYGIKNTLLDWNLHNIKLDKFNKYRNLFIYWIGREFSLIKVFRELIYLHSKSGKGYNIHFINEKNLSDYIKYLPKHFYDTNPASHSDYIRSYLICEHGGIWLDGDTIVLDNLDYYFDIIESTSGFFIKEAYNQIQDTVFGSKPNTKLMIEWREYAKETLERKTCFLLTELGNQYMHYRHCDDKHLFDNYVLFLGKNNIYPNVNRNEMINEFLLKPYDNYKILQRNLQPLIIVNNRLYRYLDDKTEQEIWDNNMPLNYFLNKSLENAKKYL